MWLTYIVTFIFGACIGSFLNVVIIRWREGRKLCGRSSCPHCQKNINVLDMIPIVSFFLLRGRCRHCDKKISWQYPLVEFLTAVLFTFVYYSLAQTGFAINLISLIFLLKVFFITAVLIVVFVSDLRYSLIYDKVIIPACVVVFVLDLIFATFFVPAAQTFFLAGTIMYLKSAIMAVAICAGFFLIQYWLSNGKWIGAGDIWLGVFMGLVLGFPNIIVAMFLAYVGGAIVSLILIALKQKTIKGQVPFGVFLTAATFAAAHWGHIVLNWYLNKFIN